MISRHHYQGHGDGIKEGFGLLKFVPAAAHGEISTNGNHRGIGLENGGSQMVLHAFMDGAEMQIGNVNQSHKSGLCG